MLRNEQSLMSSEASPCWLDDKTPWKKGQQPAVLVPLFSRKQIFGELSTLGKKESGSFTHHDLDLLTMLANQASTAIENAAMSQQVQRTGKHSASMPRLMDALCLPVLHEFLHWPEFIYNQLRILQSPLFKKNPFCGQERQFTT